MRDLMPKLWAAVNAAPWPAEELAKSDHLTIAETCTACETPCPALECGCERCGRPLHEGCGEVVVLRERPGTWEEPPGVEAETMCPDCAAWHEGAEDREADRKMADERLEGVR